MIDLALKIGLNQRFPLDLALFLYCHLLFYRRTKGLLYFTNPERNIALAVLSLQAGPVFFVQHIPIVGQC